MRRSKFKIDSKNISKKKNKMEMKAQIVVNVVPISIVHVPSLLHQNHIRITYVGTSNFRMELIRSVPLHFMAML
jgi:hypothetical protein